MSAEPLLTYLMPAYAAASYSALLLQPSDVAFPATLFGSSTFGASWAAYNMYRSKTLDLGLFTMGIVAASSAMELGLLCGGGLTPTLKKVETAGCALAAVNFMLPLLAWPALTAALGRKKTALWFQVFFWYCLVMAGFWAACAYKNMGRTASEKLDTEYVDYSGDR